MGIVSEGFEFVDVRKADVFHVQTGAEREYHHLKTALGTLVNRCTHGVFVCGCQM